MQVATLMYTLILRGIHTQYLHCTCYLHTGYGAVVGNHLVEAEPPGGQENQEHQDRQHQEHQHQEHQDRQEQGICCLYSFVKCYRKQGSN